MKSSVRTVCVIAFTGVTLSATQVSAQPYTFTFLGTLGGTHSDAYAINNTGVIAGSASIIGNTATHATVWQQFPA